MESQLGVPVYLFHPMFVHFPIALLSLGLLLATWAQWARSPTWIQESVPWTLWIGTLTLWAALGLGLLAEAQAPHIPAAWHALAAHKAWAYRAAYAFSALSIWRIWAGKRWAWTIPVAWVGAWLLLVMVAHEGATLVYQYGMGMPPS